MPWPTVGKLRELFVAMSCEYRELEGAFVEDDGAKRKIRFLYSREQDDFVSLSDYADDERVPWSEVENWERRLGVTIPRGNNH